jgi:predicted transcriptional regulator
MAQVTIQASIAQMEEFLERGLSRKEIAKELNLPMVAVNAIFQHPKLKNRKAKKLYAVEYVDDSAPVVESETAQRTIFDEIAQVEAQGFVDPIQDVTETLEVSNMEVSEEPLTSEQEQDEEEINAHESW